ncbi:MAG TPA: hypothetical protein VLW84_02370 [Terriglobales bacterium]|nr:hypothetical protein [Terriglobales bacterium]
MVEPKTEDVLKQKSDPTLRDLLAPLFRHKRVFVYTFVGVMLGTVVAAFILNNIHKAHMEILVNSERTEPTVTSQSTQGQAAIPPVGDYDIGSEVELLSSPNLLQGVVIANKLQDRERQSFTHYFHPGADEAWYIARATDHLGSKLDIEAVSKSRLIKVEYKSGDPYLAYNVLDTLGKLYLEQHLAIHRPPGSFKFFATQTDNYERALADSEARLAEFTRKMGTAAPDVQRTAMAQQVVDSVATLQSAQQAIAADDHRIEDETNRIKFTPERSLAAESTDPAQSLTQNLQAGLLATEVKKTQLLMKYESTYPLVQEADREISQTKDAITSAGKEQFTSQTTDRDPTFELMKGDITKTQADLASHRATAQALEDSIHSLQKQIVKLDLEALEQSDLSRDVKANEANYLLYLSKREQERTSDALDEKRIANVAIAVPPILPILPWVGPVLVMAIGLCLAVILSAGAAFLAEYLNPSLRTPDEVLEVLRIPVLASVPKQTA